LAQQQSQNEEVKKFAAHMIEQHRQAVAKIQQAVPQVAGVSLTDAQTPGTPPTSSESTELQMAKAVKQQCLQLTKQDLSEKQGADFDKCYIGQQIGAHIGMLAELRGSKNFANPQLQQVIQEGEKMAEMHLAEAKRIIQKLDKPESTARSATTPARQ
jgi:predicted outer membrane protein